MLAQDLGERPVRDCLPVGEAAARAPQRLRRFVGEPLPELAHEPCLADAGVAEDRDQPGPSLVDDGSIRGEQPFELVVPADEGSPEAAHAAGAHERERPHEPLAYEAFGLPLRLDRLRLAELERAANRSGGALSDQYLTRGSTLLH